MPWGSWVTCEETVNGPDVGPDFTGASNVPLTKPHGFVFEVPASAFPGEGQSSRQPIRSAGRFAHEAVSYDPHSGYLYLTEDDFGFASGFYRYKPPSDPMVVGRLEDGGTLEMLKVVGVHNAHLEGAQEQGATYRTEWVPIEDPDPDFPYTPGETAPTTNNAAITHVARQGWAQGAAYFSRLEGQVARDGVVYFTSTQGGGPAGGRPREPRWDSGTGPDRCGPTTPPRASCGASSSPPGRCSSTCPTTSRRRRAARSWCARTTPTTTTSADCRRTASCGTSPSTRPDDEFAGSTFSPDGRTLFVNIQASRGRTFAIWGPWHRIGV